MTNTAPTTLSARQAASQSTFIKEQLYCIPLVISRNDKKAANIIKPTLTRINRENYSFLL
jgi:hypothetical protein